MKKRTTNPMMALKSLSCSAFGHRYQVTQKVTNHINEYECTHCGKEVTDNVNGYLDELTIKTKKINATLSNFLEKKRSRVTASI
jgi:predicted nucleic acid-binding Zn ribbon protein